MASIVRIRGRGHDSMAFRSSRIEYIENRRWECPQLKRKRRGQKKRAPQVGLPASCDVKSIPDSWLFDEETNHWIVGWYGRKPIYAGV